MSQTVYPSVPGAFRVDYGPMIFPTLPRAVERARNLLAQEWNSHWTDVDVTDAVTGQVVVTVRREPRVSDFYDVQDYAQVRRRAHND